MQTIPLVASFAHKSPAYSSHSTTPVLEDEEDGLSAVQTGTIEPHTPPTFSMNQPGKLLHQQQGNSSLNQPLQGVPFVSQVSQLLQSTDQLPQEIPQLLGLHHPLSNPPYGLPPLNQVPLPDLCQGGSEFQPMVGPTGQAFPSQAYVTSVPPPPPPSQPPPQDYVIHHGGTSSTAPTVTTRTPSEMAAEAALKRQQSACGASTVTVQNTVVTTTVTKTPVVVITASEMPPSSLFFTSKSQTATNRPSTTESTSGVHQFGTAMLDHSTSIPANFHFNFSAQNPSSKMQPFFTSGSQTSLPFGLSTSNNDKFSSMGSLSSKFETSFPKPTTSTAPPADNLLSKSESSFFKTAVTTSSNKPSSLLHLLNSANASEPSISDSLTKPFIGQKESEETSEETSEEENEQSEDGQDKTLTNPPVDNDSPVLSLDTKSVASGSMPTLVTPVITTLTVAATTIKSSVTFSAPSVNATLSMNKPTLVTLVSTEAPPTSVAITAALPTLLTATTVPPTSSLSTTTLSSTVVLTAPPTLIADSLPTVSATKSTTSEVSSATTSTSGTPPITESEAPPITESTAAPPIAEATAPPTTTSAAPPSTTVVAPPSTTVVAPSSTIIATPLTTTTTAALPTITSAAITNPISVVPPTPSTTAPPSILSMKTTEATSVSNPPALAVPLWKVADKPSDSEGESDVIDNGLDRVASQSSLASNMTDDINVVDDSEGEMDKEPASMLYNVCGACVCTLHTVIQQRRLHSIRDLHRCSVTRRQQPTQWAPLTHSAAWETFLIVRNDV